MDSEGTYRSVQTRKYSLTYSKQEGSPARSTDGGFGDAFLNAGTQNASTQEENDVNGESSEGSDTTSLIDRFDSLRAGTNDRVREIQTCDSIKSIEQVRQRFVLYLWRIFFGEKRADELAQKFGFDGNINTQKPGADISMMPVTVFKIEATQETYYEETQELSFNSTGHVTTADGRTLDFNLEVGMSSSFSEYYREDISASISMCDPLVLNFSGDISDLTDQKFYFDLDADGEEDEISGLSSGNGFLALDSNEDGLINDGSELFGTRSGNGFHDLAAYDDDGNGWIDENDDIYDKLKIWVKDNDNNDILYSLKDKNVGAIYLGNVDTAFLRRSGQNGNINGMVRSTGIFLYEDGTGAGTISHLDIAN